MGTGVGVEVRLAVGTAVGVEVGDEVTQPAPLPVNTNRRPYQLGIPNWPIREVVARYLSATVPGARWRAYPVSNGKVAFMNTLENAYLGRCHQCYQKAVKDDFAFIHFSKEQVESSPAAQWTVTKLSNGNMAIKSDMGYLGRCAGCVTGYTTYAPDQAGVHITDPLEGPYAQFRITCVDG